MSENKKPNNPSAFPYGEEWTTRRLGYPPVKESKGVTDKGMDLRDYFAAKALAGVLSANSAGDIICDEIAKDYAVSAYELADAMLKQREL